MTSISVSNLSKCYRLGGGSGLALGGSRLTRRALKRLGLPLRSKRKAKEVWALKNVSFDVQPGTVLGIIGPNGAGKTTLLKVIGRITPPTQGRVAGRGRVVSLLEVGTGFQPTLSGRDNIFLHAAMYGVQRADILKKLDRIVEFAEIEDFIEMPLKHYSSGMYARLAFSVAVNMEPDILLADEVLAVGDQAFKERCLLRVEEAGMAGMTVLFGSHDMHAVKRICSRVLHLNAGEVVADGDPESVTDDYQLESQRRTPSKASSGPGSGFHAANDLGEILAGRLLTPDRREISAATVDNDFLLRITFRTTKPGLQVRCGIDVHTRGMHAFRSTQPELATIEDAAVYSADIHIPAHLLSEAIYNVHGSVWFYDNGSPSIIGERNIAVFKVLGSNGSDGGCDSFAETLPGAVSPKLDWHIAREAKADVP